MVSQSYPELYLQPFESLKHLTSPFSLRRAPVWEEAREGIQAPSRASRLNVSDLSEIRPVSIPQVSDRRSQFSDQPYPTAAVGIEGVSGLTIKCGPDNWPSPHRPRECSVGVYTELARTAVSSPCCVAGVVFGAVVRT